MHTNEVFSNWEKSREGESDRKMRGREEKGDGKKREGKREGGRQRGKKREEGRGWGWNPEKSSDTTDLTGYPAPRLCTCIV